MTVAELIEKLQAMPNDALVMIQNGEIGDEWVSLDDVRPANLSPTNWNDEIFEEGGENAKPAVLLT